MKILTVTDSPLLYSGLARVHRNIIDALTEAGHNVLPCGWFAYTTETLSEMKRGAPAPELFYNSNGEQLQILPVPKRNNFNEVKAMYDIVMAYRPDVILTVGDFWDFYYMQALKVKCDFSFKWFAYLTIERDEIDEKLAPLFKYADMVAAPTQFGKSVLEPLCECPVRCIPYGVDSKFRRLPDDVRAGLREERDCTDKIRFITVAQNTLRKNIPALIQAVKLIAHRDPQRKLQFYVHSNTDRVDPQEQCFYDLRKIVEKLGMDDWFVFPEEGLSLFSSIDDDNLVNEYNAADFFVSASTCEGYGLPLIEAMACGLPVIANGTSVMPEHLGAPTGDHAFGPTNRGWLVHNRTEIVPPDRFIKIIRFDSLGQAIWEMSQWAADPQRQEHLRQMRQNCIDYAKERPWAGMKRGLCAALEEVAGPVAITVEVLR